jgi:lipopolysaccharide biosynthesis regulator YciM
MELIILLVAVVAAIGWFIWNERQHDKNNTHPLDSVTKPNVLDVNKDGKVDIKDAVAVVEVAKEEVKTVAKKAAVTAEATVKKARTPRKPKA